MVSTTQPQEVSELLARLTVIGKDSVQRVNETKTSDLIRLTLAS